MRYLIRNGMIVDGTGRAPFAGSVLTRDSKIEAIFPGRDNEQAGQAASQDVVVLDAGGGYITPGFVDIHRHGDWQALERGDDELLNRQGITTVINGNCGLSAAPQGGSHELEAEHFLHSIIGAKPSMETAEAGQEPEDPAASMKQYLAALSRVRRSVHTGMLVGGGTVRASVAGYGEGALTQAEEESIRRKIVQSLEEGALGVSLGLGYAPEYAYDEAGLIRVLEPIRGTGTPIAVHIRTEGDGADHAVADGLDVTMDTYPYITGSTQLVHLIPPRYQKEGTQALLGYLQDPSIRSRITRILQEPSTEYENIVELAGFENIAVTGIKSEAFASCEGKTIADIAWERGQDPYDTLYDVLLAERCECAMLDTYGCEEDLIDFLKDETCSVISDAIYPDGGRRHPRVYDAFPRFLISFVREKPVFRIEEAVRKMTSLPASVYHLERGVLEAGKTADICVFHLENLRSHADFTHPDRMCTGFDYVLTAGEICVKQDHWIHLFPKGGYRI